MYNPPHDIRYIDSYMLSRFLQRLDALVPAGTKICLVGGTALTALRIRKQGSRDVDIVILNNPHKVSSAIRILLDSIKRNSVAFEVQTNGVPVHKVCFPENLQVDVFENVFAFIKIPHSYRETLHRVNTFDWVMPEGGKQIKIASKDLFNHIEVFTLGIMDLFCCKLFHPRDKDIADIHEMLFAHESTIRLVKRFKKQLRDRVIQYIELNKSNTTAIVSGIGFYNNIISQDKNLLLPLPKEIEDQYLSK